MHECEYYQSLMSRLLDEGLAEEEEKQLRNHIRTCPSCAKLFSVFSSMTVTLRDDRQDPPSGLTQNVMDRIAEEDAKYSSEKRMIHVEHPPVQLERKKKSRRNFVPLASAACLVLLAGVGIFWFAGRDHTPSSAERSVPVLQDTQEESRTADGTDTAMAAQMDTGETENTRESPGTRSVQSQVNTITTRENVPAPTGQDPSAPPEPTPLEILDVARHSLGSISVENTPAFENLLQGTEMADSSQGDWEFLFTVEYDDRIITFATDEEEKTLVWWDDNHPITMANGSPSQLLDIAELKDQPLPR